MEYTKIKLPYAKLLLTVAVCCWSALTVSSFEGHRDDYRVTIVVGKGVSSDIWYGFYTKSGRQRLEEPTEKYHSETTSRPIDVQVDRSKFPALQFSEKTRKPKFVVAESKEALDAVLQGTATAEQKKLVASASITQKGGAYCYDTLTFLVSKIKGKLSIEVRNARTCTFPALQKNKESTSILTRIKEKSKKLFSRGTADTKPVLSE